MKPVVKWIGGKTQMLPILREQWKVHLHNTLLARAYDDVPVRYIEPFVGGGALFFDIEPIHGIIADVNAELITMYRALRGSGVDGVINALHILQDDYRASSDPKGFYYEIRAQEPTCLAPWDAAARMIFLNRTCFNGMYRVNKYGQFNNSYGAYPQTVQILDEERLRSASRLLTRTQVLCGDYLDVLGQVNPQTGDFVFLDPPYAPSEQHQWGETARYTAERFRTHDQEALRDVFGILVRGGCRVVLTNSDTAEIRELYKDYEIMALYTRRSVSSKGSTRRGKDVLIVAGGKS